MNVIHHKLKVASVRDGARSQKWRYSVESNTNRGLPCEQSAAALRLCAATGWACHPCFRLTSGSTGQTVCI